MKTRGLTVWVVSGCLLTVFCAGTGTNPAELESRDETSNAATVIDLTDEAPGALGKTGSRKVIERVVLQGKVRHFGYNLLADPPHPKPLVGIPGVKVWIAEYPFTKYCNILTDQNGIWRVEIIKPVGWDIPVSFAYEKDFYPREIENRVFPDGLPEEWTTTKIKSNVHTISSSDITDLAVQMPDEIFLFYAKSRFEQAAGALSGTSYTVRNIVVATVGKAWASIYDPRLPHGDPGAVAAITPSPASPLQGPAYFDETVTPDPTLTVTSVDGGVMYNNLAPDCYTITAVKKPYTYEQIRFRVTPCFNLYISSPPHSIQGTNASGPGEY